MQYRTGPSNESKSREVQKVETSKDFKDKDKLKCYRFGDSRHLADKCPFKTKECYRCKKVGHVIRMCKAQEKSSGGDVTSKM